MIKPDFAFETSFLPKGTRFLLGIDEVGRGPLAGPVTIGAFLLDLKTFNPSDFISLGVRDSKLLTVHQRQKIYSHFTQNKYIFKTFSSSSTEIDQQGIATCIYSLMNQAIEYFSDRFDFCLIDGNYIKQIGTRSDNFQERNLRADIAKGREHRQNLSREKCQFVVKGDQKCFSVASASICAKVVRDDFLDKLAKEYPQYGFSNHKGYGTKQHLDAIKKHGPSPHHRMSFKPIKNPLF